MLNYFFVVFYVSESIFPRLLPLHAISLLARIACMRGDLPFYVI